MPREGPIKSKQRLGKYRIDTRLGQGGFASVWRAFDTIEGIPVALKIPHAHLVDADNLKTFQREVRLVAGLDHPNVLPLKYAGYVDGQFVIVTPLGRGTLSERLARRMSVRTALGFADQILEALAYAHGRRIAHCDVKPENMILFEGDRLRLGDFGIAKVAYRTLRALGTGTVGYVAPEQAMGRPSLRSDVFSVGLTLYRMLSGRWPEWPYVWPFPGHERLKGRVHPELVDLLRRSLEVDPKKRFEDAQRMHEAYKRVRPRALRYASRAGAPRRAAGRGAGADWTEVRQRQFQREHRAELGTRHACGRCHGPVSEAMLFCPWCARERRVHKGAVALAKSCPRCGRGAKRDWSYCAWCWGAKIGPETTRRYPDRRYVAPCAGCGERALMPFARYCPQCSTKVRRRWKLGEGAERCRRCRGDVLTHYWRACPWCGADVRPTEERGRNGR